jgi:hypothetical protein
MREKLNESKAAQIGLVGVLVVIAAIFFLKSSGGGEGETTEAESETTVTVESGGESVSISAPTASLEASPSGMGELPTSLPAAQALPPRFTTAYDSGRPVALLVVHNGGIDDAYTTLALRQVSAIGNVAVFVVPAKKIADYASVTVGLDVSQVPALIVLRPKGLSHGVPQASVSYGYQTPQTVYQQIRDAAYAGPESGTYHPG